MAAYVSDRSFTDWLFTKCQTPLHGHRLRTPPTDKNLPHPNILTCRDAGLWHCDVANLLSNCCELVRWWCPLVVLYNMSVAGVRLVEFGPKVLETGSAVYAGPENEGWKM